MVIAYKITIFTIFFSLLSACSVEAPLAASATKSSKIDSIELFMSRASASSQDFEQLKLSNNQLYKECGPINRGRFAPLSQEFVTIERARNQELLDLAANLSDFVRTHGSSFEKPGTNKSFADPGQVLITLEGAPNLEIKASLDSISNAKNPAESKVKKLVESMRGAAGGTLCGNQQFYGIAFTQ